MLIELRLFHKMELNYLLYKPFHYWTFNFSFAVTMPPWDLYKFGHNKDKHRKWKCYWVYRSLSRTLLTAVGKCEWITSQRQKNVWKRSADFPYIMHRVQSQQVGKNNFSVPAALSQSRKTLVNSVRTGKPKDWPYFRFRDSVSSGGQHWHFDIQPENNFLHHFTKWLSHLNTLCFSYLKQILLKSEKETFGAWSGQRLIMNLLYFLIAFTSTVSSTKCCIFPGKMWHIFSLYIFRLISFDAVASPCPLNCVFRIKKNRFVAFWILLFGGHRGGGTVTKWPLQRLWPLTFFVSSLDTYSCLSTTVI